MSSCTTVTFSPFAISRVEYVWRNVCHPILLRIPARNAAGQMIFCITTSGQNGCFLRTRGLANIQSSGLGYLHAHASRTAGALEMVFRAAKVPSRSNLRPTAEHMIADETSPFHSLTIVSQFSVHGATAPARQALEKRQPQTPMKNLPAGGSGQYCSDCESEALYHRNCLR